MAILQILPWATTSGLTDTETSKYLFKWDHSEVVAFLHLNQKSLALKTELDGKVASLTRSRSRSWMCGMPQDDEGVGLMPSRNLKQEKWTGSSPIKGPSLVNINTMYLTWFNML